MARRRNAGLGTGRGGGRGTRGDGGVGGDFRQRWSVTRSPGGGGVAHGDGADVQGRRGPWATLDGDGRVQGVRGNERVERSIQIVGGSGEQRAGGLGFASEWRDKEATGGPASSAASWAEAHRGVGVGAPFFCLFSLLQY